MKYYVADFNGILTDLKNKLSGHLATPRDADAWVVWQDCQGSYRDLIETSKKLGVGKPTFCVQHGGHSTYDYDYPNKFKLNADRYLCWGQSDYDRMVKLGYKDRTRIVGCPLNPKIGDKVPHKEKVVLFVPVSTGKEEPENIAVYYEMMKLRYSKARDTVLANKEALKDKWGLNDKIGVSFNELAQGFDVITKILPWHDKNLYHGSVLNGYQDLPKNNELVFSLLRNVDLVVGLDEGTTETFAYGHDVPVIVVDGFKFRQHGIDGKTFEDDGHRTKAATHVALDNLAEAIEYGLAHPEHLRQERAEIAEAELGLSYKNPTENILKVIRNETKDIAISR